MRYWVLCLFASEFVAYLSIIEWIEVKRLYNRIRQEQVLAVFAWGTVAC